MNDDETPWFGLPSTSSEALALPPEHNEAMMWSNTPIRFGSPDQRQSLRSHGSSFGAWRDDDVVISKAFATASRLAPAISDNSPGAGQVQVQITMARELDGALSQLLRLLPLCTAWLSLPNQEPDSSAIRVAVPGPSLGKEAAWAKEETACLERAWAASTQLPREWLLSATSTKGIAQPATHANRLHYLVTFVGERMRGVLHKRLPDARRFWRAASTSIEFGIYFQTSALLLAERYVSATFGGRTAPHWSLILDGRRDDNNALSSVDHLAALREMQKRLIECSSGLDKAMRRPPSAESNASPAVPAPAPNAHGHIAPPIALATTLEGGATWNDLIASVDESSPERNTAAEQRVVMTSSASAPVISKAAPLPMSRNHEAIKRRETSPVPRGFRGRQGASSLDDTNIRLAEQWASELAPPPLPLPAPLDTNGQAGRRSGQEQTRSPGEQLPRLPRRKMRPSEVPFLSPPSITPKRADEPLKTTTSAPHPTGTIEAEAPQKPAHAKGSARSQPEKRCSLAEVQRAILQVYWMASANKLELNLLGQMMWRNQMAVAKHGVIYNEGVMGDRMYILVRGAVRLTPTGGENSRSRQIRPINSFGEGQIIAPCPREETAVALSASVLIYLTNDDLFRPQAALNPRGRNSLGQAGSLDAPGVEQLQVLIGTLAALLVREGLWVPKAAELGTKRNRYRRSHLLDVDSVTKSVRQGESLLEFAARQQDAGVVNLDLDGVQRLMRRAGRRLTIVSQTNTRPPTELLEDDNDGDYCYDDKQEDGLSLDEFVAAGRVGWLRPKAHGQSGWSRLRPLPEEGDEYVKEDGHLLPTLFKTGRITGRPGTPPEHLRHIRTREERLSPRKVNEAMERAENLIAHIADSDANGLVDPQDWMDRLPTGSQALLQKFAANYVV